MQEETTAQKMKFSIKDFFSKCDQFPADLITFTDEILNGNLHFLCRERSRKSSHLDNFHVNHF